jgi:hypothetical protein
MSEEIRQDSESGIKFIGRVPPQFQEAVRQVKQEKQINAMEAKMKDPFADVMGEGNSVEELKPEPKSAPKKQQQVPRPQGKVRPTGSAALEEILLQLRGQSYTYDEVVLPSKGTFYNGGDAPTDGVLHIRPMTGEEEQILATPRYIKKGTAINMIFQRCVKEKIKPDELLSIDRTYLLIALRNISYGHEYEVDIKCPGCDKKFNHTIRLDQLLVEYCPPEFQSPLTDVLPKSGLNFIWHLPRGRDENLVSDYREKRSKEYGDLAIDDSLLFRIALMIDAIETIRDKTEILILLKKLPIQDISYLRGIAGDPPFGVNTKCEATCSLCYHDFEIELPLEAGFFFPRHKKRKEQTEEISGDT